MGAAQPRRREGHCRQAAQVALQGGRHRAGDEDIVPQIWALVNAGDYNIYTNRHQLAQRQDNGIAGRTLYRIGFDTIYERPGKLHPERLAQRYRRAGGALLPVRGDNKDTAYIF